jgi:hypothetical protein
MAFEADSLTEETLGSVHVANHADQRRVGGETQFTAQYVGARGGERIQIGTEVRERNAVRWNTQLEVFAPGPAAGGDPMVARACKSGIQVGEEGVLEMKGARYLKNAGDGGGFAQGGSDDEGGADVMSVNNIWANIFDQGSAGFEYGGNLPGAFRGNIEIYGHDGGAKFMVFGCGPVGSGGKSDHYFKAQGAEDADLMVDPGCSRGGFDDVKDLHEERVVMARSVMNAVKTIPQKGALRSVQRCKQDGIKANSGTGGLN